MENLILIVNLKKTPIVNFNSNALIVNPSVKSVVTNEMLLIVNQIIPIMRNDVFNYKCIMIESCSILSPTVCEMFNFVILTAWMSNWPELD